MEIFRWRRKKQVASNMDDRFGDPSISAPTQGSWNEMPPLRPVRTEFARPQSPEKVGRFQSFVNSQTVNPLEPSAGERTDHANFPRHPMVDMQGHQRSVSMDRISRERILDTPQGNNLNNNHNDEPQFSSSSHHRHHVRKSYDSSSGSEEEEEDDDDERVATGPDSDFRDSRDIAPGDDPTAKRSLSREDHWRAQQRGLGTPSRQHKSPPLSSTAMMRRNSSQSESTRTYASTPSTASFSSRRTSITTPGTHGFPGPAIPPLLKEEEYLSSPPMPAYEHSPPMPTYRNNDRNGSRHHIDSSPPASASHNTSQRNPRNKKSNKQPHTIPVGPQELVPSNDELWGY